MMCSDRSDIALAKHVKMQMLIQANNLITKSVTRRLCLDLLNAMLNLVKYLLLFGLNISHLVSKTNN